MSILIGKNPSFFSRTLVIDPLFAQATVLVLQPTFEGKFRKYLVFGPFLNLVDSTSELQTSVRVTGNPVERISGQLFV